MYVVKWVIVLFSVPLLFLYRRLKQIPQIEQIIVKTRLKQIPQIMILPAESIQSITPTSGWFEL